MSTLDELLAQKAKLETKIKELQDARRSEAIAEVHALMDQNGLTAGDLTAGPGKVRKAGTTGKVATKYRSTEGDSWSGRGLQPRWLKAALAAGKKIEEFAV